LDLFFPFLDWRGAAETAEARRTESRTEEIVNFMFEIVLQKEWSGRRERVTMGRLATRTKG
jgi:hypothetical protein